MVLLLVIGLAALLGLHQARKLINQFTDTRPDVLPTVDMSPSDIASLEDRVRAFRENIQAGRPTPPLSLSAQEINGLIAGDAGLEPLKGKVFVTIEGNELKGQVSLPMEDAGLPMFKGRYLNGTGTFEISLNNGILRLTARRLEVKGRPVPSTYMQEIRKQNLARIFNDKPRVTAVLDRLSEVKVEDGRLVILPGKD